jgi:hypothetical protein
MFDSCPALSSIAIPASVTTIGLNAFNGCTLLASVTFTPISTLTSIFTSAFFNCSGLTSITIPNTVTSIGSNAFFNCSGLTSIIIPDSVTTIGTNAFQGSGLATVYINPNPPSNLTPIVTVPSVGTVTFYGKTGVTILAPI